ncbi:hypothetical protein BKA70DRAFT_1431940 [Coprinopsis sp. MPI-PUGE-AT-0042]|nr:hypothetical protein BKA70DRAFT_1431940 [Coprinopsis sp. MPI-PUGE-AT-0042]
MYTAKKSIPCFILSIAILEELHGSGFQLNSSSLTSFQLQALKPVAQCVIQKTSLFAFYIRHPAKFYQTAIYTASQTSYAARETTQDYLYKASAETNKIPSIYVLAEPKRQQPRLHAHITSDSFQIVYTHTDSTRAAVDQV